MDEGKEKSTSECEAEKIMKKLQEGAFMEGYRYAICILKESEVKGDWKNDNTEDDLSSVFNAALFFAYYITDNLLNVSKFFFCQSSDFNILSCV